MTSAQLSNGALVYPLARTQSGCGRGDVDGDYVTPLCISTLPGAQQLVLPDVWHIPRRNHLWYGDAPVVDKWSQYLPQPQPQAAERM